MNPGLHINAHESDYRKLDAVHGSLLKAMRRSPLHAHHYATQPPPSSRQQKLGTAVHMALLEPDRYRTELKIGPTKSRSTKAWKEWDAITPGSLKLLGDEALSVERMVAAVHAHELASDLIDCPGDSEATAVWRESETGVLCKARADRLCQWNDELIVLEVKTAQDATPRGFRSACWSYGYDLAAGWYAVGFNAVFAPERVRVVFLVVENEPPHGVALYELPRETMGARQAEALSLCRRWARCREAHDFPSYPSEIVELPL